MDLIWSVIEYYELNFLMTEYRLTVREIPWRSGRKGSSCHSSFCASCGCTTPVPFWRHGAALRQRVRDGEQRRIGEAARRFILAHISPAGRCGSRRTRCCLRHHGGPTTAPGSSIVASDWGGRDNSVTCSTPRRVRAASDARSTHRKTWLIT